jgi:DNA mismatch endonuclease (patch repair protein)
LYRLPKTRQEFWADKIQTNRERDSRVEKELKAAGWQVLTVWECSLRNASDITRISVFDELTTEILDYTARKTR